MDKKNEMIGDGGQKSGQRSGFSLMPFVVWEAAVVAVWFSVLTFKGPWAWADAGALGALFAAMAFIAVFFILRTQKDEFSLQRESLDSQRETHSLQRQELSLQREELGLQREELETTREEFRRMAVANAEAAELGRKNVRAQYLMFWIGKNTEAFAAARKIYDEALAGARVIERQLMHYQNIDTPLKKVLAHELDQAKAIMAEKQKLLDPYVRYEAELDQLTRELNRPVPVPGQYEYRVQVESPVMALLPPEE